MLAVVVKATMPIDEASILNRLFKPQPVDANNNIDCELGETETELEHKTPYEADDLGDAAGLLVQPANDIECYSYGVGYSGSYCYAPPYPVVLPTAWDCIKHALHMPKPGST
jgi:hypothetical protein